MAEVLSWLIKRASKHIPLSWFKVGSFILELPFSSPYAEKVFEVFLRFLLVERSVISWRKKGDLPNWFEKVFVKKVETKLQTLFKKIHN